MLGAILAKRAVRQAFGVLNSRDAAKAVAGLADAAVMDYPGSSALSGRYEGKAAITDRMVQWFEMKDHVDFKLHHVAVENVGAMGPSNNVIAEWTLSTVSASGEPMAMDGVTRFRVKGGKVVDIKDYLYDPAQATACYGSGG
ncbi:MAG: nuclear transport factor 2 family protein [Acidimicrobiia bacterium]|nr:nuclear transport factor 2 family protein [Acidimicrobiia bacterium]